MVTPSLSKNTPINTHSITRNSEHLNTFFGLTLCAACALRRCVLIALPAAWEPFLSEQDGADNNIDNCLASWVAIGQRSLVRVRGLVCIARACVCGASCSATGGSSRQRLFRFVLPGTTEGHRKGAGSCGHPVCGGAGVIAAFGARRWRGTPRPRARRAALRTQARVSQGEAEDSSRWRRARR